MYGRDYYLELVADTIIIPDIDPNFPLELQEGVITEFDIQAMAEELEDCWPHDVESGIWKNLNLRAHVDALINSDNLYVRDQLGGYDFTEQDRLEILERASKRICAKLRQYIDAQYKICYKVMSNGRVGFRLEK